MLVRITYYNCCCDIWTDSEPMLLEDAMLVFKTIKKQAMRGFRPFPKLICVETGEEVEEI